MTAVSSFINEMPAVMGRRYSDRGTTGFPKLFQPSSGPRIAHLLQMARIKMMKFITLFAVGGTERQFLYLSKGLDRSRFDLQIGCIKRLGAFLKDVEALNVPITEYRTNSMYSHRTLQGQIRLAR